MKRLNLFPAAAALAIIAVPLISLAAGPGQPYAGQQGRAIKALSADDVAGLLAGKGMGFAKAAELNHYPGPRHLLDLAGDLGLAPQKVARIEAVFKAMNREAARLGKEIVGKEGELDALFASARAEAAKVEELTAAIGVLWGRLRAVHLKAHIVTRPLLGAGQVARYDALRGYGPGGGDHSGHGKHKGH